MCLYKSIQEMRGFSAGRLAYLRVHFLHFKRSLAHFARN